MNYFEVVDEFCADASVEAGRRLTLVDVRLAEIAGETWATLAAIFIDLIETAIN